MVKLLPDAVKRNLLRALLCALVIAAAVRPADAQVLDSKGKEFWAAFMSNLGSGNFNEISDLRIYLSCNRPTTVNITYMLTGVTQVIPIPTANVSVEVNVNQLFGDFVELDDLVPGSGEITQKSLHITCNDEISLYGANIRSMSADAFLGLPVDVLTGRYIVLAYPNGYSGATQFSPAGYDTPSQFCVVATEDGTKVDITPPTGLTMNGRPAAPFSVNLNKGQIFFGQADVIQSREQDVSGTQVSATKPVAVFSGNKRTSIPTRVGNFRDHLCEQMPPLDAWGKGALLTPHFKVTPESGDTAVARILAAFPGTDVTVTGAGWTQTFALGPNSSLELPLLEPMAVYATQPIMVAQFEHSVNVDVNGFGLGDPFMMLIPPAEQFDTAYTFQSIAHREFTGHHYVNLVIPTGGERSFRLDGNPLVGASFAPIPGSRFVYAQYQVAEGSHYIRADSAFGLYAYGFGRATSYGYPGGMLFRKLVSDFNPPEMLSSTRCGELDGIAYDSRITDSGVDSCYTTTTDNAKVTIDPFTSGADTVRYHATLLDPYQDGKIGIRAIDSGGRSRTIEQEIPGFTVRVANTTDVPALVDTFVVVNAKKFCRPVQIRNYGKFPQNLTGAHFTDSVMGGSVDQAQFPITIPPGGFATIDVCFEGLPDTVLLARLGVFGDCGSRDIALLPIDNRLDTTAPSAAIEGPLCGDDFTMTYFEQGRSSGIASITFDSMENCTVENTIDPTKLPAQVVTVKLHRIDPRKEIVYTVTLRDAVGNSIIRRDTIGGFTLNLLDARGDTVGTRFDRSLDGDSLSLYTHECDSVLITNYGTRPLNLERAIMRGNRQYSIPPSQFPLTVPPKGTAKLSLCMEGLSDFDEFDTLVVLDACGNNEMLLVKNPVRPLSSNGLDRCGDTIGLTTFGPTKRVFLTTPTPNPSQGGARVDIGLTHPDNVDVAIFAADGRPVMSVVRNTALPAGISRVSLDVSALENGSYFCRMTTASGDVIVAKMIIQR